MSKELLRWALPATTFAVLLAVGMSAAYALLFSAIPFLLISWAIKKHATDRHEFFERMHLLSIMFALLPAIALMVIGVITGGGLYAILLGAPLLALAIWLVAAMNRKKVEASPETALRKQREHYNEMDARYQAGERRWREEMRAREQKIDAEVDARVRSEMDKIEADLSVQSRPQK